VGFVQGVQGAWLSLRKGRLMGQPLWLFDVLTAADFDCA
jgi:hypothetical protein